MHTPTCVTPTGDVAVAGLVEDPLPLHWKTDGKNVTTKRHTASWRLAQWPRQQANQGQVVILAIVVVMWVKEDLMDAVFLFMFFRDKRVMVPDSDLILLARVSIPAGQKRTEDRGH